MMPEVVLGTELIYGMYPHGHGSIFKMLGEFAMSEVSVHIKKPTAMGSRSGLRCTAVRYLLFIAMCEDRSDG